VDTKSKGGLGCECWEAWELARDPHTFCLLVYETD
jgi:hypothetical protein